VTLPSGYKRTEIGNIPDNWSVINLGERAKFRTGPFGSALHKSDYTNNRVPVINPMHIIEDQLAPTESMSVTENAAKQLADFRLRNGDIIIGRRGDMGLCYAL
jgi:type I restriction enzyme S subunit